MAAHGPHPKIREAGLADGCERCGEMAADPLVHLDSDNLRELVRRTRAWMRDQEFPRSENELIAMREVERLLVRMQHIARVEAA
jgi:hypothetical protein